MSLASTLLPRLPQPAVAAFLQNLGQAKARCLSVVSKLSSLQYLTAKGEEPRHNHNTLRSREDAPIDTSNLLLDLDEDFRYPIGRVRQLPMPFGTTVASAVGLGCIRHFATRPLVYILRHTLSAAYLLPRGHVDLLQGYSLPPSSAEHAPSTTPAIQSEESDEAFPSNGFDTAGLQLLHKPFIDSLGHASRSVLQLPQQSAQLLGGESLLASPLSGIHGVSRPIYGQGLSYAEPAPPLLPDATWSPLRGAPNTPGGPVVPDWPLPRRRERGNIPTPLYELPPRRGIATATEGDYGYPLTPHGSGSPYQQPGLSPMGHAGRSGVPAIVSPVHMHDRDTQDLNAGSRGHSPISPLAGPSPQQLPSPGYLPIGEDGWPRQHIPSRRPAARYYPSPMNLTVAMPHNTAGQGMAWPPAIGQNDVPRGYVPVHFVGMVPLPLMNMGTVMPAADMIHDGVVPCVYREGQGFVPINPHAETYHHPGPAGVPLHPAPGTPGGFPQFPHNHSTDITNTNNNGMFDLPSPLSASNGPGMIAAARNIPPALPQIVRPNVNEGLAHRPFAAAPRHPLGPDRGAMNLQQPGGLPPPHRLAPADGTVHSRIDPTSPSPRCRSGENAEALLDRILAGPARPMPSRPPGIPLPPRLNNVHGGHDALINPTPRLGSPLRICNDFGQPPAPHGRPRDLPPVAGARLSFANEDDEIIVPNHIQRAQGVTIARPAPAYPPPCPPLRNIALPPITLPTTRIWVDDPLLRPKQPWHEEALYYADLENEQPMLKRNGLVFKLTMKITNGGAGRVVEAEHGGKRYAVKVMHKWRSLRLWGYDRESFKAEKEAMLRANDTKSPYLVKLFMSWEDQHQLYFVMPLYPMSMNARVGMKISQHDKVLYCAELILALQTLHQHNIVHHDIKSDNILIDTKGRAVLADFGLVRIIEPGKYDTWKNYDKFGTASYLAPEVVAPGHRDVGHGPEVDVWSLGIVFLEIFGLSEQWNLFLQSFSDVRTFHEQQLPLNIRFRPSIGDMPKRLLPVMLEANPASRIRVRDLHEYIPEGIWQEVVNEVQTHDWQPPQGKPPFRGPVGRCLEFASFKEAPIYHAKDAKWMEQAHQFHMEEDTAQLTDFEYRAPGVFLDS